MRTQSSAICWTTMHSNCFWGLKVDKDMAASVYFGYAIESNTWLYVDQA